MLGAILLHNDAFNLAAEVIDAADFFRDAHRRIFDKMVRLSERGDAIDLVTLKEELGRSGELDEVGGPAYITALVDGVPRSTNVEHYARIIKEKATLRSLIFSANKILATAYEAEEEADVILDQAEHAIFAIADDKIRDGFVSLRDLAQASLDTIEKLHARKELITGVPTGFTDLDEMTSGLQPSDLIIVAARPSMGKTSLVLNIAQHVGTKTDMTVGVFSLEMSKEQLFLRMLTAEARIDAHRLRGGFLGERDWGRLSQAIGTLSEAKIFIDDTPSIGVLEMRAKCRRLAAEHGLHLVIIDYIQLMQGRGRFENRTLELASISRSLKGLAKELSVPIVVLSQLSRAPEVAIGSPAAAVRPARIGRPRAGRRRRRLHLPRGSSTPTRTRRRPTAQGVAELIIGKQRNGPTGVVKLAFIREFTRFENLAAGNLDDDPTDRRARRSRRPPVATTAASSSGSRAERPAPPPRVDRRRQGERLRARRGQVARALEDAGADLLACADIEEGAALRAAGVRADILVFGALSVSDLDGLFDCRLTPTISTPGAARAVQAAAARYKQRLRYHLKIDTGMNRLGFRFDNLRRTLPELLASENLELEAVYTHFATADDPGSAAVRPAARAVRARAGGDRRAARRARRTSGATVLSPRGEQRRAAARLARLVRPRPARPAALRHRAAAAGVDDSRSTPVMTLDSRVVAVKGMRPGEVTGYGARFTADASDDDRHRAGRIRRRPRPAAGRPRRRC